MADPLSVIGAVAATAQLAEQLLKVSGLIYELYTNMQQGTKLIGARILAVDRLISISRSIMANKALQTAGIALVLRTCLETSQKIRSVLENMKGNRLKQAVMIMAKEKEIVRLFGELEKEKSSLMLCMQETDVEILDEVRSDIRTIRDDLIEKYKRMKEISANFNGQYFEVPNRKVRSFIGREDILSQIKDNFLNPELSSHVVVLRAMGGQGKTQIALEICHQLRETFSAIFWIDSSSENALRKDYGQIYDRIKLCEDSLGDAHSKSILVQKSLSEWPHPWLVVFDNYDDIQGFTSFPEFIPQNSFARILITSRHADTLALADGLDGIELLGLDKANAIKLLVKQSGQQSNGLDNGVASTIVERLGYHPLAIDQAGSYIHKRRISLQEFLLDYESRQKTVLQEVPRMSQYRRKISDVGQEIPLNVFTTCELSLQQLLTKDDIHQTRGQFLTFMAFLYCSPLHERVLINYWNSPLRDAWIPRGSQFLSECLGLSDNKWDSEVFRDRLVELRDLSLVQSFHKDENGYLYLALHPLIQDWLVLRLDHATSKRYSLWATNIVLYSASSMVLMSKKTIAQYIVQNNMNCKRFLAYGAVQGDDVHEWAFSNGLFSDILVEAQLYEEAERTITGAISAIDQSEREKTLAPVLRLKRHLARILQLQCRWNDATNMYREISWEMAGLDPKVTYLPEQLFHCAIDIEETPIVQMLYTSGENNTEESDDVRDTLYRYDLLNSLSWNLSFHAQRMEADALIGETFQEMKRIIIPACVHKIDPLDSSFGLDVVNRLDPGFDLDFFALIARIITLRRQTPRAAGLLTSTVKRALRALSIRRESQMEAYHLLSVITSLQSLEQGKSIVNPKTIHRRILRVTVDSEMLEILLLLAEILICVEKFHEARQVAERALIACRERYGTTHVRTLRCQLMTAIASPLPDH